MIEALIIAIIFTVVAIIAAATFYRKSKEKEQEAMDIEQQLKFNELARIATHKNGLAQLHLILNPKAHGEYWLIPIASEKITASCSREFKIGMTRKGVKIARDNCGIYQLDGSGEISNGLPVLECNYIESHVEIIHEGKNPDNPKYPIATLEFPLSYREIMDIHSGKAIISLDELKEIYQQGLREVKPKGL